ncbi:hypothetical protein O1611_g6531 [Lasiodiplodia mahajangana]|uniref:Uncharacterized protein n=1 Tax=Lasiodiplodia mahajangana TaxID=1108764 RepID=A0ACC2JIJ4_9PEZI|nr:hypothetical protein O1611_g6531 [Lasiodiplodia mahajangana]
MDRGSHSKARDDAENRWGSGRVRPSYWRNKPEGVSSLPTNFEDTEALEKTEQLVNETWKEKFNAQPYSSFFMVSWLSLLSGITVEGLWQNPRAFRRFRVIQEHLDDTAMDALASVCGRCSTFTIQVAEALQDAQHFGLIKGLPKFEWEFHDISRHRLARCKNTGLVIHSSSPQGFLTVPPGETLEVAGEYPRSEKLSYTDDGISKLKQLREEEITALKSSKGWITQEESLAICLNELAEDKDLKPLCFFRHTYDTPAGLGTQYYGMIVFALKERRLELRRGKDSIPVTFYWNNKNTNDNDTVVFDLVQHESSLGPNYHTILAYFITHYSGPNGANQWRSCLTNAGNKYSKTAILPLGQTKTWMVTSHLNSLQFEQSIAGSGVSTELRFLIKKQERLTQVEVTTRPLPATTEQGWSMQSRHGAVEKQLDEILQTHFVNPLEMEVKNKLLAAGFASVDKDHFDPASPAYGADSVSWLTYMSKLTTAVSLLQLVERDVIALNDDIRSMLPELAALRVLRGFDQGGEPILEVHGRGITLHHLLPHTLGMDSTTFHPDALPNYSRRSLAYAFYEIDAAGDATLKPGPSPVPAQRDTNNDFEAAGLGLFSTIADYARLLQSILSHKVLKPEMTDLLFAPQPSEAQRRILMKIAAYTRECHGTKPKRRLHGP